MSYAKLSQKIEEYVASFYTRHVNDKLVYHTYPRTTERVIAADRISKYLHLDERTAFIVSAAAWFHDAGYLLSNGKPAEVKSVEVAENFLRDTGATEDDIIEIKKSIVATKNPNAAASIPERIICDADTFYFGTSRFKAERKLARKELEGLKKIKIDPVPWTAASIDLLEKHQYFTDYCKSLLNKTKEKNLNKLKNKQAEKSLQQTVSAFSTTGITEHATPQNEFFAETTNAPKPDKKPTRGIETMFRISSSNSQKISSMADNKAHIMISVNSIIISVVLGTIVRKLGGHSPLILPTLLLLCVNVATIVYSVLATRPKVHKGIFTNDQVKKKSVNLLFYGSFYNMELKDFDAGMRQMMNDREFLYGSLIKDVYWQGKVLGRKYRLLHTSYNVFMYGIAMSVVAFTIAIYFAH